MGITKCNTMDAIRSPGSQSPDRSSEGMNRLTRSVEKQYDIYCPLTIPDVYWM